MRLVLHHLLDRLGSPVMESLTFRAAFTAREIKVFHDNDVDLEFVRNSCDEVGRLDVTPFALAQSLGVRFAPLL